MNAILKTINSVELVTVVVGMFIIFSVHSMSETTTCLAATSFQTNLGFDPRIDLQTDEVIVHKHGSPRPILNQAIDSWARQGYKVSRMFFVGSDAGRLYTDGWYDGRSHVDETEQDSHGNPVECGGTRPYMVPTEGWNEYIKGFIREAIDADATCVLPEEPLAHSHTGYSPAFAKEWQAFYGVPWAKPSSSVDAFYKASKLSSHLYYDCVREALEYTKDYGASNGKDVSFVLPTHSLVSHSSAGLIFPTGKASKLEQLDGIIGQVWTGPVGWSLGVYEGRQETRDSGFFESAYILYSYFANLCKGTELKLQLIADPVEDDPSYGWDQYAQWYERCLAAQLLFPSVKDFEVMPWPDRIYLPGYNTGGETPGPADYRASLNSAIRILSQLGETARSDYSWNGGSEGIGVLVADTMGWQRGGPSGSTMESFHGLILPLLKAGIPAQVVPLERVSDKPFMSEFKVLLLSYDMQKPLSPSYNESLADWVRDGGSLLFYEGDDPYNKVDEWWKKAGYYSPGDHLLDTLGLPIDLSSRELKWASKLSTFDGPTWLTEPLSVAPGTFIKLTNFALGPGNRVKPLGYISSLKEQAVAAIFEGRVGRGNIVYAGIPAAAFAKSAKGANAIRALTRHALELAGGQYRQADKWLLRRGNVLIARSFGKQFTVDGPVIDVMDSTLTVRNCAVVEPFGSKIFYTLSADKDAEANDLIGLPRLLFANNKTAILTEDRHKAEYAIRGPAETPSLLRIATNGKTIKSLTATGAIAPMVLIPGSNDEERYMVEGYETGLANGFRFADLDKSFIYMFDTQDLKQGGISVNLCNNFVVDISKDGDKWVEVLRENEDVRDGRNRMDYQINFIECLPSPNVYVRFRNTDQTQGWGPNISKISLDFTADGQKEQLPVSVNVDSMSGTVLVSISQPPGIATVLIEWN